jgi:glycosyltransferase involved in cell wall biosynthesis
MKFKLIRITTVPISLKILLKGQLKYMNQYFDVIAVSCKGDELEEVSTREGVITKDIEMSRQITPIKDLVSLYQMILFLKKEKPSIVHTHTPKAGLIGMLASFIVQVPHRLHTVAGLPLMESKGVKRKILLFVEWLTYKCATRVYPNSFAMKVFIEKSNLAGENKLKVIGNGSSNGIDTTHFDKTEEIISMGEKLKKNYLIDNHQLVFIFVGRIVKDKGINELLDSFDTLSNSYTNIKLLLVGAYEDELDPISDNSKKILQDNKNIINVGYQNDVRPFFAISHCLVFPSYREGFPNVVMQAGAMSLPSIVTDINGCNEIIKDRRNGLIVAAKDKDALMRAMKEIIQNDNLRVIMSQYSRDDIIDRYSQKYMWDMIKNEYNLLMSNVRESIR